MAINTPTIRPAQAGPNETFTGNGQPTKHQATRDPVIRREDYSWRWTSTDNTDTAAPVVTATHLWKIEGGPVKATANGRSTTASADAYFSSLNSGEIHVWDSAQAPSSVTHGSAPDVTYAENYSLAPDRNGVISLRVGVQSRNYCEGFVVEPSDQAIISYGNMQVKTRSVTLQQ